MAQLKSNTRIWGNTIVDGALNLNGGNVSTSSTTGALIVSGGAGISGNLNLGPTANIYIPNGIQNIPIGNATANTGGFTTLTAGATTVTTFGANGAASFTSTLSGTATITLSGATNTLTSLGTSATTGTLTLGGTAQTGNVTLGQTTSSATIGLHIGQTASTNTKTLNIGTGGLAGSNTTILVGPTLGFGTATFATNTNVRVANTAATTSATTGALTVLGGVGVSGDIYVGGEIIIPNLPAFRVYGNTSAQYTAGTTVSNQVIDYNQGSNYNNATGLFTAPIAGLYHCFATVRVGNNNGLNQAAIQKNSDNSGANVISFWETDTNAGTAVHFGMTGYAKCVAGDTIRLRVISGNINFDSNDSWGVTFVG